MQPPAPPTAPTAPRRVLQGLCGWSCASLQRCKRFFPSHSATHSLDKLRFLSGGAGHGCVEVNSSTYAIPSSDTVASWMHATHSSHTHSSRTDPFVFHFKAFGLLCGSSVAGRALPQALRHSHGLSAERSYTLDSLTPEARLDLWTLFNNSLQPAVDAGKMGAVVFQFHLSFLPTEANRAFVKMCATHLRQDVGMAVEFRDRSWLFSPECEGEAEGDHVLNLCSFNHIARPGGDGGEQLKQTCCWLRSLREYRPKGVALVASEDLFKEVYRSTQVPSSTTGTGTVPTRPSLPTALTAFPTPEFAYIRVHRREGDKRVLTGEEISRWAEAVAALMEEESEDGTKTLNGPCYVLWGTDHEDQPIVNMKHLNAALPESCRVEMKEVFRSPAEGMKAMFARATKIKQKHGNDDKCVGGQSTGHVKQDDESGIVNSTDGISSSASPSILQKRKTTSVVTAKVDNPKISRIANDKKSTTKKSTIDMFFKKSTK